MDTSIFSSLMELPDIRLPPRHGARMRRVREGGVPTAPASGCCAVTCRSRYPKAGKSLVIRSFDKLRTGRPSVRPESSKHNNSLRSKKLPPRHVELNPINPLERSCVVGARLVWRPIDIAVSILHRACSIADCLTLLQQVALIQRRLFCIGLSGLNRWISSCGMTLLSL
jgi:hypothetical protein